MSRRQTRVVIITAAILGLFCLGMVFWALTRSPDPVAEPVPFPTTSAPSSTSAAPSSTVTSTTTAAPTTTTTTPKPTPKAPVAQPPKTTTHPPAPPAPPATTINGLCQAAQWQPNTQYNGGALVLHNGAEWYARSWNYNAEPGANAEDAWIRAIDC